MFSNRIKDSSLIHLHILKVHETLQWTNQKYTEWTFLSENRGNDQRTNMFANFANKIHTYTPPSAYSSRNYYVRKKVKSFHGHTRWTGKHMGNFVHYYTPFSSLMPFLFRRIFAIRISEIYLKIWNQIQTEFESSVRFQFACASVVYVYALLAQLCLTLQPCGL